MLSKEEAKKQADVLREVLEGTKNFVNERDSAIDFLYNVGKLSVLDSIADETFKSRQDMIDELMKVEQLLLLGNLGLVDKSQYFALKGAHAFLFELINEDSEGDKND